MEVLDGDEIRRFLSAGLGFSREDRNTNVQRIGLVAEVLARNGVLAVVPVIAPYADSREAVRKRHEASGTPYIEVHVATPVEVCSERDVKGLYARQAAGRLRADRRRRPVRAAGWTRLLTWRRSCRRPRSRRTPCTRCWRRGGSYDDHGHRSQETPDSPYALSHLDALESEAVHIFREVAGEFERPVILFSGGKDSIVMLHLALKAFAPAAIPFTLLHVDTGHNFPEVLEYRDRVVADTDCASMWPPYRTTSTAVCCANAPTAPATPCRPCR